MQQQISLHEANRHLTQYIHAVEEGAEYVITRRGKPVARIVPLEVVEVEERRVLTPTQEAALERIKQRLEIGYDLGIGKIDRETLYLERWERGERS